MLPVSTDSREIFLASSRAAAAAAAAAVSLLRGEYGQYTSYVRGKGSRYRVATLYFF